VENLASKIPYAFPVREVDKRLGTGPRSFDLKKLWSRQKEIINLDSLGYKGVDIARMLDVTPLTVSNALNSTLGKVEVVRTREERDAEYETLREDVLELTKKSLIKYEEILAGEAEVTKMQKDTADTVVLELSGLRAPTRIDSRSVSMHLTNAEIEEFKQRGIEAARESGRLVTVEGEGTRNAT